MGNECCETGTIFSGFYPSQNRDLLRKVCILDIQPIFFGFLCYGHCKSASSVGLKAVRMRLIEELLSI